MNWSLDEIGCEVNTKYYCIGILRHDHYDKQELCECKTFWFCILPCIAIRMEFSADILGE